MIFWFWEVGGTILASCIIPCSSTWYRCQQTIVIAEQVSDLQSARLHLQTNGRKELRFASQNLVDEDWEFIKRLTEM